ncbi:MAG: peptidoglycan DD-metalloendopeptidase family protein [Candidatus Pacebacteria bacterium]|nr:peptidoglycan DD-metalloendopeptidase family protein [Candidatus Paceibacterota bacterium]
MRLFTLSILIFLCVTVAQVYAEESADSLRTKIQGNRGEIQKIENEIKKYEKNLNAVLGKKKTLQNSIYTLDQSRQKTSANIRLTENKISVTKNKILTLTEQISDHVRQIDNGINGLSQALRSMNEVDEQSFVELLLQEQNIANAWTAVDSLRQFQSVVGSRVRLLSTIKQELAKNKNVNEVEKRRLAAEKDELKSNKETLDINRRAKDKLLKTTKNKESEYQKILAEKRKAKEAFEAQMAAFEAQLKFILNKDSIPEKGSGIFAWPVKSRYVTQYFGNTKFAQSGAYSGRGHNGMDFRAPIGARVSTVLSGTVQEINKKVVSHCQYGKWILVKHNNGLTTLYAHLSNISVKKGEVVTTGQRIGYAGDTGYAFGPHLHLTVYASDAVKFKQYTCNSGSTVKVPISAYSGYLNPLDYL